MDAEKSILVTKSPAISHNKVIRTNICPTSGKKVTITTDNADTPYHQHLQPLIEDILPAPDYNDESQSVQKSPKEVNSLGRCGVFIY